MKYFAAILVAAGIGSAGAASVMPDLSAMQNNAAVVKSDTDCTLSIAYEAGHIFQVIARADGSGYIQLSGYEANPIAGAPVSFVTTGHDYIETGTTEWDEGETFLRFDQINADAVSKSRFIGFGFGSGTKSWTVTQSTPHANNAALVACIASL